MGALITLCRERQVSPIAAATLRRGAPTDSDWRAVYESITHGTSALFRAANRGWVVLEIQDNAMHVCACGGRDIHDMVELCVQTARVNRCRYITYHTIRPGIVRMMRRYEPVYLGRHHYRIAICE